jgi:hypothetical protein
VGARIIRVADRYNPSVDVGGQSIDGIEDRLRYAASLVDDHEHVAGVDALECSRVVVSRLAAVRDKLVADVPLGIEGDPARQVGLPVGNAHVAPEDCLDLWSRWRRGDHVRLAWWMHIDPPERQPRDRVGLRNVVRRFERAVAILNHRLSHPVLARPPELAQGVSDPADRISQVRVLARGKIAAMAKGSRSVTARK